MGKVFDQRLKSENTRIKVKLKIKPKRMSKNIKGNFSDKRVEEIYEPVPGLFPRLEVENQWNDDLNYLIICFFAFRCPG